MRITETTTEKQYSITYFRPQSKSGYGFSVGVTGSKKKNVIKEAKELLEQAIKDAEQVKKTDTTYDTQPTQTTG